MSAGKYTFETRLLGDDASQAAFAFVVAPQIYQRPLVLAFGALGLLLLFWGAHRFRLMQLRARYVVVSKERARIARELHDHLAQGFMALGFHLDALRMGNKAKTPGPQESSQERNQERNQDKILERARDLVDHCQADVRRLIWDLREDSPESQG